MTDTDNHHQAARTSAREGSGRAAGNLDVRELPALLPIPRAAKLLGLTRTSTYRYAATGELPVKRLGGRVYVVTAKIRYLLDPEMEDAA